MLIIGIDFLEKKSEVIRLKGDEESEELFTFDIETPNGTRSIAVGKSRYRKYQCAES